MPKNKMVSNDDLEKKSSSRGRDISSSENKKEIFSRKDNVIEKVSFGGDETSVTLFDSRDADNSLGFDIPVDKISAKDEEDGVIVKEVVKRKVRYDRGSGVRSLLFTVSYLIVVLVLAVVLARYIITRANDAFAFVKDDITVEVTIDDTNMSLE